MSDHAAFLTYVRFDDEHENGRLSEFCKRLSGEIRVQTGEPFHIFQDRSDIAWGQQWRVRIDQSLDAVTFLVAVITPGFFKRPECRKELERFLEREQQLGRGDLILPVYYVNTPALNDEAKRKSDPLMQVIASRQYADWRDLRFEPWTSPQVGKTIAVMAQQIAAALERRPAQQVTASASAQQQTPAQTRLPSKSEPPTRTVDPLHRGDYATVSEAVKAAKPGDRILVRPGLYAESVIIDKPLEIIGDGDRSDIVIDSPSAPAISFRSTMGRVANLTLRRGSGEPAHFCVDISQGRLDLDDCDVSSQSLACVGIHAGADPRLRRNVIHDGTAAGVFVYENARGTIEDNDIFANRHSGVEIKDGGNPMVRRNRIHDGKQGGVFVYDQASGTIEDNDILANGLSGVAIRSGGNPVVRRNRIHGGKESGVMVYDQGMGTVEDNDIFANRLSGVVISNGSNPVIRRNRIHDGKEVGVFVNVDGLGTVEDNEITDNRSGVEVASGGKPTVQLNRITKNRAWGVIIRSGARGVFERNDLRENGQGSWYVDTEAAPHITRNDNQE